MRMIDNINFNLVGVPSLALQSTKCERGHAFGYIPVVPMKQSVARFRTTSGDAASIINAERNS